MARHNFGVFEDQILVNACEMEAFRLFLNNISFFLIILKIIKKNQLFQTCNHLFDKLIFFCHFFGF